MGYKAVLVGLMFLALGIPNSEAAKKKASAPAVELGELISDPRYLQQALGPKALVVPDYATGGLTPVVKKALIDSRLVEKIEFFPLPAGIKPPIPRVRQVPRYPQELLAKKVEGEAHFLMVIGADGKIKGLYCHQSSHPAFAKAAAAAIAQWLFVPVKVETQTIPVVTGVSAKFTLEEVLFDFE